MLGESSRVEGVRSFHWTNLEMAVYLSPMSAPESVNVHVTQEFIASAERVFDAWLSPELIGRWMFGPKLREEEIVHLEVDPRVGGTFSFLVRRQGQEFDHIGQYLELDRPKRLVFTWGIRSPEPAASRVIITIKTKDPGCELNLVHELHPDWAAFAERTEAGWRKMLAVLFDTLSQ